MEAAMEVQRAQLTKAFKTFDADSTGFLNEVELRNLMCGMVSCIPLTWFRTLQPHLVV